MIDYETFFARVVAARSDHFPLWLLAWIEVRHDLFDLLASQHWTCASARRCPDVDSDLLAMP